MLKIFSVSLSLCCVFCFAATGMAENATQPSSLYQPEILHEEFYPDGTLKMRRSTAFSLDFFTEHFYAPDGTLKREADYSYGALTDTTEYLPDLMRKETFYYPDGKIKLQRYMQEVGDKNYVSTRGEGESLSYRKDGSLKERRIYRAGYSLYSEEFDNNGKLVAKRYHYKNGDTRVPDPLLAYPEKPLSRCTPLRIGITDRKNKEVFQQTNCTDSSRTITTPFFTLRTDYGKNNTELKTELFLPDGTLLATVNTKTAHNKHVSISAFDDMMGIEYKKNGLFGSGQEWTLFFRASNATEQPRKITPGDVGSDARLAPAPVDAPDTPAEKYHLTQYYASDVSMEYNPNNVLNEVMLMRDKRITQWFTVAGNDIILDQFYDLREGQESIATDVIVNGTKVGYVMFMAKPDHVAHPLSDTLTLHVTPKDMWLEERL
ncbi:toxin-antitoxin system YwqK family antitoxin [Oleidesulfovibrio sp.]|uniref:toxin-antitoxin system YwqK family antitoxin n=1 Tax=Oleidesulfovibrio sp. TaxID=2909707 RepID=UPI003A850057